MPEAKLNATLHKEPDGTFALYFCRGEGKCTKTPYERAKMSRKKQVCRDCIKGRDTDTLGGIADQINRGDA